MNIHPARASTSSPWGFRDDFNYATISQLQAAGWTTESIAPASYYSIANSTLTELNDGQVGAGAGYSNIPANVSDWSVSTRIEWIGASGSVSGYVGSLQVAVGTAGHTYVWMADGYYNRFAIGMDGHGAVSFPGYVKQLNVWHVLQLDMIHGTLYGYFDGLYVGSYTEPDTTPGNTQLTSIQALASWETNNNFDWMQANNSPSQPPPSPTYPYFALSANPASIVVQAGLSGSSTIEIQGYGTFSGTVGLSATTGYYGPSAQINPTTVTLSNGGSATATLTITAPASTSAGAYYVTVYASGGNITTSTTLTVTIASGSPDFSITAPSSSFPPGSQGQARLDVSSINGFSGNVSLSVSSPASLSASINPASVNVPIGSTASSVLTVAAATSTPLGSYNISITGVSGSLAHSITVAITIAYPGFTISETPTSQTIPLGSEQQTVLDLESVAGFSGNVSLVATPSSTAIACWFTYTLNSTATLYVPSGGSAYQYPTCGAYGAAGSYTVTFTATSGSQSHSITLQVTLTDFSISAGSVSFAPPSSGSGNVSITSLSGLAGPVSLSVSAPSAVTVSCPLTLSLTPGGTTTISCSYNSSLPGTYGITITGSFVCNACYYDGNDSHSVSVEVSVSQPSSPDFYISANPSSFDVKPGSSADSTITLTSLAGFTGTVNLSVAVSPSGSSASLRQVAVTLSSGGTGTTTLTLSTTSTTPTGFYAVTLTANSGNFTHSITVGLTVSSSGFTISESPTSQAIPLGSEMQTDIYVNSVNGFSGNVNLVATASSTAVACWFSGTLTNEATIFVPSGGVGYQYPTCGAYGSAGTYTVTMTGTSGSLNYSIVLPVTVMDYSIAASSVSFTAGSSGTSSVSLASLSGLSGSISLGVSSPSGLTASCSPSVVLSPGGTSAGSCTFTAASPGTYSVTITGTFVCSSCYYDGTDSHSTTATVTVTSTDPPVSSNINVDGVNVKTTGGLTVASGIVSGTVSVMATNSSNGATLFSKTYAISNVGVANNRAMFLLNVAVNPYPLSADVRLIENGGVWSATVMVTRQLDIAARGTVDIVDVGIVTAAFDSTPGTTNYSPSIDVAGRGIIDIVDVGMLFAFYGAPDYR